MEEKAYYIGLTPSEFKEMNFREFQIYYEQRMKFQQDNFKMQENLIARVLCMLANINRDTKKKPTPFKITDFISSEVKEKKKQSPQEMAQVLKMFTVALGGEVSG